MAYGCAILNPDSVVHGCQRLFILTSRVYSMTPLPLLSKAETCSTNWTLWRNFSPLRLRIHHCQQLLQCTSPHLIWLEAWGTVCVYVTNRNYTKHWPTRFVWFKYKTSKMTSYYHINPFIWFPLLNKKTHPCFFFTLYINVSACLSQASSCLCCFFFHGTFDIKYFNVLNAPSISHTQDCTFFKQDAPSNHVVSWVTKELQI